MTSAQLDFTEVASPSTFENDPELAWGFYGHRLKMYRDTVPHQGFVILKEWAQAAPMDPAQAAQIAKNNQIVLQVNPQAVSYTHLTLPTSDLV